MNTPLWIAVVGRSLAVRGISAGYVLLAFAGMQLPAAGGEARTNTQFTVKLVDGSSIVCSPALTTLPLKTSFGDVSLALEQVETISFNQKAKSATFVLLNGDRLQGEIGIKEMMVSCALGDLKMPLSLVSEVATRLKREPVYEDSPERRTQCLYNLRVIDSAKEQSALSLGWASGVPVQNSDGRVNAYIKGNATPICPAGGKYTYGAVGVNPKCSVPGHEMPGS